MIKSYLLPDFPVRLDSPSGVSLFAYDNGTFIVESFLPSATTVRLSVAGAEAQLRNALSNEPLTPEAKPPPNPRRAPEAHPRSIFTVEIQPHSYAAFSTR